ncbi:hypothetical protein [Nonomuraea endophytica]|uniref:Uncharacterized protein n=1 Tax=Nonomuraea endophytica TaxID=714136 RepID=A0A7W8AF06_9ACTN|nr:hypothetical protein [Nonomuraea endophytica]MBB5083583.1 hypothetical protein [Nonomuraea endophytica]
MEGPDLDDFITFEELVARTREIVLTSIPVGREAILEMEESMLAGERTPTQADYIYEVAVSLFEDLVENGNDESIAAFLRMSERLLELGSGLVTENVDVYVAGNLRRNHPYLIRQAGPRLRALAADH